MPETGNLLREWTLGDGFTLADWMLLGQEIGRWEPFVRQAKSRRRRPELSVFAERTGSLTQYVKNVTFTRRIQDSLHEPQHGKGRIVLQDKADELIQNGRSVIGQNDKIKVWAGFGRSGFQDGDLIPRFAGIVKNPQVNTRTRQIALDVQDYGYLMKQAQTSGDWSDYDTPTLMIIELLNRLNLLAPEFQNATGLPVTYTIGNTTLSRRNYWKIADGALKGIGYVMYFDASGDMQCKRRDNTYESDNVFYDADIISIMYERMAEVINEKGVKMDGIATPWAKGTAADSIRWGQAIYTKESEISQAQNGIMADYEAEPMVAGWDNILPFGRDSVDWLQYPRHIILMKCTARPYLDLMDVVRVDSDKYNIHGQMTILGVSEYISSSNYNQTLALISHKERF